jgi:hypothetical protein
MNEQTEFDSFVSTFFDCLDSACNKNSVVSHNMLLFSFLLQNFWLNLYISLTFEPGSALLKFGQPRPSLRWRDIGSRMFILHKNKHKTSIGLTSMVNVINGFYAKTKYSSYV